MKERKLRILVATGFLFTWRGSELVTIELIEGLRAAGAQVDVMCLHYDREFIDTALGVDTVITNALDTVNPFEYDLIYNHHQMASHLIPALLKNASNTEHTPRTAPVLVYNHLSSSEPLEMPGPFLERYLADYVWANSPFTKLRLHQLAPWLSIDIFPNPAPAAFERPVAARKPDQLRRLMVVSNHVPDEVADCVTALRARGVDVTHLGQGGDVRRLSVDDITAHDAILTIGKSTQYAIQARVPVFCYDRFNGPGWLTAQTFDAAAHSHFSGLPVAGMAPYQARDAHTLADEIQTGFSAAWDFMQTFTSDNLAPYRLEPYIATLLDLAAKKSDSKRLTGWSQVFECSERRSELALEYEGARLTAQLYQGRQVQALNARTKRLEQAATIKALRLQLKKLKARLA